MDSVRRTGRDLASVIENCLYVEDLAVGDWVDVGMTTPSREEIIAFAGQFDPLPIHLDGADSPFGDVIASGIHTMALYSSLASRAYFSRLALVAGKGIDRLRFPHPVRPSTVLRGALEVVEIVMHATRADVHALSTLVDPDDNTVLSFIGITVVRRREPEPHTRLGTV
jgi:acyl dehydratase